MLLPHRNLLFAVAAWVGASVAAIPLPALLPVWRTAGLLLLAAALADAWLALRRGNPLHVERRMNAIWPLGVEQKIRLRVQLRESTGGGSGRRLRGLLFDHHPDAFAVHDLPLPFNVAPGEWIEPAYRLTANERGDHRFGEVHARLDSPFRLWHTQHRCADAAEARVYPNFARVTQYALLATDDRLAQMGVLRRWRRGEGSDFHQLREYRRGDPPRSIDWKATARVRKPIVREYQDERDQQIVFLLDCGQRMLTRDDTLSHFDHTLNAMLLLAYVALRQGDAVGFGTFAHAEPRYFPPRKSAAALPLLLDATYDLQASAQTSDYLAASDLLCRRLRKRSLVILLTNLRDEDDATLPAALEQLRRRHLVLLASLRETGLDKLRRNEIGDFDDALGYAAAIEYLQARQRQFARLRGQGAHLLDTSPKQLPVALVNRYWDMKRGGVI
ncbi:MAG: DUF58 domain-containing protein [Candidatus Accumulibacter sp.]|jgi:uncharacterized protein (DUF58 family)|nr:DUF58 domain-containing protein [Accumulibacter sp.]